MEIRVEVQQVDALKIQADVLVLKYAQAFHGVDALAFSHLALRHRNIEKNLPDPNGFLLLESLDSVGAEYVLFTGVEELPRFRYKGIRNFAFRSLSYLANAKPETKGIVITLHGASFGLDETEAFEAEVAGLVDAIAQGLFPASLEKIIVAELHEPRVRRLQSVLEELLPGGLVSVGDERFLARRTRGTARLAEAGITSEDKPLIFVAMPFDKKLDDVFHYGIRNAVNNAGFLCERADEVVFTGDILELIKRRIRKASLIVADLTSANPNVYLEVGYAWGLGIPTVLLAQDAGDLKFDVKGQKCIIYSGIRELEEKLSRELLALKR